MTINRQRGEIWKFWGFRWFILGWMTLGALCAQTAPTTPPPTNGPVYELRAGSFDGIGKWFLGREIAHYMTHHGAMWLERPEREEEEQPTKLIEALQLKPGQTVADIGAGSGYFSWRIARKVAPTGRVYATDIQPEMIGILRTNMTSRGVTNVIPVLGSTTNAGLPANSIDLAIMVDVYHEFDHPYEMMQGIVASLRPGGRVVFIEYRGEDKWVPIKPLHKMTEAQLKKEMGLHPVDWTETLKLLPRQHVIIFQKHLRP
jgi:precorrin-6B methylase 2